MSAERMSGRGQVRNGYAGIAGIEILGGPRNRATVAPFPVGPAEVPPYAPAGCSPRSVFSDQPSAHFLVLLFSDRALCSSMMTVPDSLRMSNAAAWAADRFTLTVCPSFLRLSSAVAFTRLPGNTIRLGAGASCQGQHAQDGNP